MSSYDDLGRDSITLRFCDSRFPDMCRNASLSQMWTDLQDRQQLSQNWPICDGCFRICVPLNATPEQGKSLLILMSTYASSPCHCIISPQLFAFLPPYFLSPSCGFCCGVSPGRLGGDSQWKDIQTIISAKIRGPGAV